MIRPGEGFEYTSGAPLATPSGMMVGAYGMETTDGEVFDVDIPAFSLDSPARNTSNPLRLSKRLDRFQGRKG